jgi:hypothetical protein
VQKALPVEDVGKALHRGGKEESYSPHHEEEHRAWPRAPQPYIPSSPQEPPLSVYENEEYLLQAPLPRKKCNWEGPEQGYGTERVKSVSIMIQMARSCPG